MNNGPTLTSTSQAPPKCPTFSYCCTKGWISAYEFGRHNIQTMALLCFSLLGTCVTQTTVNCSREFSLKVVCRKDPGEQTLRTGLWSWRNHKPASDECPALTAGRERAFPLDDISPVIQNDAIKRLISLMTVQLCHLIITMGRSDLEGDVFTSLGKTAEELAWASDEFMQVAKR